MKLIFQRNGDDQFEIQAGEFDSLLEIKAKVEEMQGIPIAKQILTVKGNTLIDDFDLVSREIEDGSRIQLDIAADPPRGITVPIKMPEPHYSMNLEVNAQGTILQLKEAIQAMVKIPIHRIVITIEDGVELLDCMKLHEIQSITESDLMVEYLPAKSKPPPPTTPAPAPTSPSPSSSSHPPPPTSPTPTWWSSQYPPPPTTPTPTWWSSSQYPPPPTTPAPTFTSSQYPPPPTTTAPTFTPSQYPPPPTTSAPTFTSSSQPLPHHSTTPSPTWSSWSHPQPPTTPTPTPSSSSQPPLHSIPTFTSSHHPLTAFMLPPTKMRLELHLGPHRIMVEVWPEHKVQSLRTKLERMKMPVDYYFIHERVGYAILKEELSFKDQNVARGDVIQIFPIVNRQ